MAKNTRSTIADRKVDSSKDGALMGVPSASESKIEEEVRKIQAQIENGTLGSGAGEEEEPPTAAAIAEEEYRRKTASVLVSPNGRPLSPTPELPMETPMPPMNASAKILNILAERKEKVAAQEAQATGNFLMDVVVNSYEGFKARGYDRAEALSLTQSYAIVEAANLIADLRNAIRDALK